MNEKTERTVAPGRRKLIKQTVTLTVAAAAAQFGFPAILRAQSDTIRIGHITPRTGFLVHGSSSESCDSPFLLRAACSNTRRFNRP